MRALGDSIIRGVQSPIFSTSRRDSDHSLPSVAQRRSLPDPSAGLWSRIPTNSDFLKPDCDRPWATSRRPEFFDNAPMYAPRRLEARGCFSRSARSMRDRGRPKGACARRAWVLARSGRSDLLGRRAPIAPSTRRRCVRILLADMTVSDPTLAKSLRALGLPPDAALDAPALRTAFLRRARALHPDKNRGGEAGSSGEAFVELKRAYDAVRAVLREEQRPTAERWRASAADVEAAAWAVVGELLSGRLYPAEAEARLAHLGGARPPPEFGIDLTVPFDGHATVRRASARETVDSVQTVVERDPKALDSAAVQRDLEEGFADVLREQQEAEAQRDDEW